MLEARVRKHTLNFKIPGGTSRGILKEKNSWIIEVWHIEHPEVIGLGEASIIEGLSPDWSEHYEEQLHRAAEHIYHHAETELTELQEYPSIAFGIEMALKDLELGENGILFPSAFTEGLESIPINGLIWMGNRDFMMGQIKEKLETGFDCLKLKIGAIDFETEIEILREIRQSYTKEDLMLRVDANGAFHPSDVMGKLDILASLGIHSIEQPIPTGLYDEMKAICANAPIPIALDEELIGLNTLTEKRHLLEYLRPQYIILKPSLVGGFKKSDDWIAEADRLNIGWWITSALESNIGLNAIAQYTYTKNNPLHQGLGTGQLFTNNFESGLRIESGELFRWL